MRPIILRSRHAHVPGAPRALLKYALLVSLLLLITLSPPATAQTATQLTILENQATADFPQTVHFTLEVVSDQRLDEAILSYDVADFSCVDVNTRVPVPLEEVAGGRFRAEWTWVMVRSGNPPPGTALSWSWTLPGDDSKPSTPQQEIVLRDDRFDWQTVREGDISLHWYEGERVGPLLLDAAVDALIRLEGEMGIELARDVSFFIYGSAEDMRQAVLYIQDWAGGVAFPEYSTILIGVPPGIAESWGRGTVQHELAHLVIGQFGRNCLGGGRPTWLEEGLAVVAQGEPDAETVANIEAGIEQNAFAPLRSLNGAFPAHDASAGIAYSQSFSVVSFMLEQYGEEKMQALLLALAAGEGYDEALQLVYGFNIDELEVAWREAIGAPPRAIPPTPTPVRAAQIPTVEPLRPAQSVPTPPAAAIESPAEPPSAFCGLGMLPLLFACVWLGGAFARRNQWRS